MVNVGKYTIHGSYGIVNAIYLVLGSKTAMICSKMVKHFLLQMASLFPPETGKALMLHLVRSIGEWKAGSVTGRMGKDVTAVFSEFGVFLVHILVPAW